MKDRIQQWWLPITVAAIMIGGIIRVKTGEP